MFQSGTLVLLVALSYAVYQTEAEVRAILTNFLIEHGKNCMLLSYVFNLRNRLLYKLCVWSFESCAHGVLDASPRLSSDN